jgi:hypothetical protein
MERLMRPAIKKYFFLIFLNIKCPQNIWLFVAQLKNKKIKKQLNLIAQ